MSIDGLSTVEGVAGFLESEVLAAVPDELRGEVRAAAKLLRTSAIELSVRHRDIGAEIADLLDLCERHASPEELEVIRRLYVRAGGPPIPLPEQDLLRGAVHDVTSRVMTRLTAAGDAGVEAFLRCLGGHAARRASWQAVFPPSPDGPWAARPADPATSFSTSGVRP